MTNSDTHDDHSHILQANLDALRRVAGRPVEVSADGPEVRMTPGPSYPEISVAVPGGRWVRFHSACDPVTEADRQVAPAFEESEPPVVVVIGPGLGYVLDAIDRRSSVTKVLALEPLPTMARRLLEQKDWRLWVDTGRLTLLLGPHYHGAADAWKVFDPEQRVPFVVSGVLLREFTAIVERARRVADEVIAGAKSNLTARRALSGPYLLNTLANTGAVVREGDVRSLAGAFQNVPAVVVAAGPSLDGNLAELPRLADRALLIGVDTALRPLLHAGIEPHVVVGVDPSEINSRHLRDLPSVASTWLAAEASLDPRALSAFEGRTFACRVSDHHPWPWFRAQGLDRGHIRAWGSVLTSAFDLACQLGCDPIVFVGADLAYTDELIYCRNTIWEATWSHFTTPVERAAAFQEWFAQRPTEMVPDLRGGSVRVAPRFILFRNWLIARALELNGCRRIVNGTGGGILFGDGVELVDLPSLRLPARRSHSADIQRRLRSAWADREGEERGLLRDRIRRLLTTGRQALPLAEWSAFTDGTVREAQIEASLDHAAQCLDEHSACWLELEHRVITADTDIDLPVECRGFNGDL